MYNNRFTGLRIYITVQQKPNLLDSYSSIRSAWVRELFLQRPLFLRFVRGHLHTQSTNPQDSEDILQAAYLKLLMHQGELRDPLRAKAWFFRVLRNLVADHQRAQLRNRETVNDDILENAAAPPSVRTRVCPCAKREVNRLRGEYRDALTSVDLQDSTVSQYASQSRISAANASVRLHRARRALRTRLEQVCGTCAGPGCFDCSCA